MSYNIEDKENNYSSPTKQRRHNTYDKSESKSSYNQYEKDFGAESKQTRKGGFSRLLNDVTNTIRNELDERTAIRTQDNDANALIQEWMLEQRGSVTPIIFCFCFNLLYIILVYSVLFPKFPS